MKGIEEIISSIDSNFPNINPTVIYNEGWMSRLLVKQSLIEKSKVKGLDFSKISNWTSEALISSPFVQANTHREGYTHADIALGDFVVEFNRRGDININDDANIFGIIEAKMGSNLSQGTTHIKSYNQATRNLACISSQTYNNNCQIFFFVVAPKSILIKHRIAEQIELKNMIQQIENRYSIYLDDSISKLNMDLIIAKAQSCLIQSLSYEEWIDAIISPEPKEFLQDFYNKAKKWNRIK